MTIEEKLCFHSMAEKTGLTTLDKLSKQMEELGEEIATNNVSGIRCIGVDSSMCGRKYGVQISILPLGKSENVDCNRKLWAYYVEVIESKIGGFFGNLTFETPMVDLMKDRIGIVIVCNLITCYEYTRAATVASRLIMGCLSDCGINVRVMGIDFECI